MTPQSKRTVAILGCVGVPAQYGGFETLAENLVYYHERHREDMDLPKLEVYCSSRAYDTQRDSFHGVRLRYLPLEANGKQAMFYDMWSLIDAAWRGTDVVILLGHGGSFVLPLLKLVSRTRFITNIDGIEWRREKWGGFARWLIRKSEAFAVRHSHVVIADNDAIRDYVREEFDQSCEVIAYGGDHALTTERGGDLPEGLPDSYALALCRIEPENNVGMILDAFAATDRPLVFVGNWAKSAYGRELREKYADQPNLTLLDPVYEAAPLRAIRARATMYVHGHSAGGTNPSLVEMMQFGVPVLAHDCNFNRYTTEEQATYFMSAPELTAALEALPPEQAAANGAAMREIAARRYTWDAIGRAYFDLALG